MKKLILLSTMLLITAANFNAQTVDSGTCGENLTWTLTRTEPNLTLTISGTGAMTDYESPNAVPWVGRKAHIQTRSITN